MFKKCRSVGQFLVKVDLLLGLATFVLAVLGTLLAIGLLMARGEHDELLPLLGNLVVLLAVPGFFIWALWDARRQSARLKRRHPENLAETRNLDEVAGIAPRPPWLG
ncbi:MAG TPA: hypothetical protein VEL76_42955 [Gemmataceae bacterium]|nr:hypothetical protein [Gemmataceae bacterium]